MARIVDILAFLGLDDTGFEADVVKTAQKAGDKAGQTLGTRMAAGISAGASSLGKTLGAVGQDLTKTGRSMTTNLTLPLVAAGGAAAHFALDFDTSLRQISGLTDVTAGELDGIREKILAMGPAVGKGPQELVDAFYFIASAGFKADEAMVVLETSAKAAAAGLGETQTIAQVLGGVINAYGKENISAARAADILTEAVSQGTAEASGLAAVIGNVVPGAAALGVSFDQVTAAMAGMTLTGVGVEESATSLIQIFSSLQKPTSQAEEALKGMGLSSAELRRQLREEGLLATLRTLEERFAGNETASAAVFGNIRALRGITALLTLDSDQLNSVFEKVNDSTGRLATAYEETEGPQRELDRAMSSMQGTAIELGQDVLPTLVEVVKQLAAGAREFGKWWRSLDKDTKRVVVQMLALLAAIGPVVFIVGKLVSGLGFLFKGIGFLAGAKGIPRLIVLFKTLGVSGVAAAGVIGLMVAALTELGIAWNDELKKSKPVEASFIKLGLAGGKFYYQIQHAAVEAARTLGVSVDEVKRRAVDFAERTGSSFDDAVNAVQEGADKVSDAATGMTVGWGKAMLIMRDMTEDGGKLVTAKASEIPEGVAGVIKDGQFKVQPAAEEMVDPIAEAMEKARQDAADAGEAIIASLISGLFEGRQDLRDAMTELRDIINHPYPDLRRRADIEGALTSEALRNGLRSKDSRVRAETATFMQELLSQYEQLAPGALAEGELINPALEAGIDSNLDALVAYLMQTAMPGITNPFDVADQLERMGYTALGGYVRGLEQQRLNLVAKVQGLRLRAHGILNQSFYDDGYHAGATYAAGITGSVPLGVAAANRYAGKIADILGITSEPRDPQSPLRGITKWGGNIIGTLAKGMVAAVPSLIQTIRQIGVDLRTHFIEALRGADLLEAFAGESSQHRTERLAREVVRLRDLLGVKQTDQGYVGESARDREQRLAQEAIRLRAMADKAGTQVTETLGDFTERVRSAFTIIVDSFGKMLPRLGTPAYAGMSVPSLAGMGASIQTPILTPAASGRTPNVTVQLLDRMEAHNVRDIGSGLRMLGEAGLLTPRRRPTNAQ
jgi:TP901 family phage tail tape measure protein